MLRYSIHFTILGCLLAGLKIYRSMQAIETSESHHDQVEAMNMSISDIMNSLGLIALFVITGLVFVTVSLVMRSIEKKRRNHRS